MVLPVVIGLVVVITDNLVPARIVDGPTGVEAAVGFQRFRIHAVPGLVSLLFAAEAQDFDGRFVIVISGREEIRAHVRRRPVDIPVGIGPGKAPGQFVMVV